MFDRLFPLDSALQSRKLNPIHTGGGVVASISATLRYAVALILPRPILFPSNPYPSGRAMTPRERAIIQAN